jgi:hypothetical protein
LFSLGADTQTDQEKKYQDSCRQSNEEEFHSVIRLVSIGRSERLLGSDRLDRRRRLPLD